MNMSVIGCYYCDVWRYYHSDEKNTGYGYGWLDSTHYLRLGAWVRYPTVSLAIWPVYFFDIGPGTLTVDVGDGDYGDVSLFDTSLHAGKNTVTIDHKVDPSEECYKAMQEYIRRYWPDGNYNSYMLRGTYDTMDIYRSDQLVSGIKPGARERFPAMKIDPYQIDVTELIEARGGIVNKPEQPIVW